MRLSEHRPALVLCEASVMVRTAVMHLWYINLLDQVSALGNAGTMHAWQCGHFHAHPWFDQVSNVAVPMQARYACYHTAVQDTEASAASLESFAI